MPYTIKHISPFWFYVYLGNYHLLSVFHTALISRRVNTMFVLWLPLCSPVPNTWHIGSTQYICGGWENEKTDVWNQMAWGGWREKSGQRSMSEHNKESKGSHFRGKVEFKVKTLNEKKRRGFCGDKIHKGDAVVVEFYVPSNTSRYC